MPTYLELMAQIESAQKQAEEVRQAEIGGVIAEIKQNIQGYDLTAADLGIARVVPVKTETLSRGDKRAVVKPNYLDQASGQT